MTANNAPRGYDAVTDLPPRLRAYRRWRDREPGGLVSRLWRELVDGDLSGEQNAPSESMIAGLAASRGGLSDER